MACVLELLESLPNAVLLIVGQSVLKVFDFGGVLVVCFQSREGYEFGFQEESGKDFVEYLGLDDIGVFGLPDVDLSAQS